MTNNERIGGLEWEASIETDTFEQSVQRLNKMIEATDKPVKKVEKSLKDTERAANQTAKSIGFFNTALGRSITTITGGFIGAGAITRVLTFFRDWGKAIIGTSSALQELESKAKVVFGDQFSVVEQQVAAVANEVGRARSSILQFAADMGAVIEAAGISGQALGEMSVQLSRLAVDLASFHNTADVEAFNALRSAITGELEPLKRFGVVMTQANLEAYALSKGIETTIDKMDQAQLTNLRYAYILNRTTTAQGDAARTADSYANQSRKLTDELKTVNEELGKSLTPALAVGLGKVTEAIKDVRIFVGLLISDIQSLFSLLNVNISGSAVGKVLKDTLLTTVKTINPALGAFISQKTPAQNLIEARIDAEKTRQTPFGPELPDQARAELAAIEAAKRGKGNGKGGGGSAEETAKKLLDLEKDIFDALKDQADANLQNLQTRRDELLLRQKLGVLTKQEIKELDQINRRIEFSQDKIDDMVSKWEDINDQIKDSRKNIEDYRAEIRKLGEDLEKSLSKLDADTTEKRQERIDKLFKRRQELTDAARFGSTLSVDEQTELANILNEIQGASAGELQQAEKNSALTDLQRIDVDAAAERKRLIDEERVEREKILTQIENERQKLEELENQGVRAQREIVKALNDRQVQQDKTFTLIEERQTEHVNRTIAEWNRLQAAINGTPITPVPAFAAGGPVPGSGNTDSVHAKLMPGEHVITKREVQNAGGHAAIFALRSELARGIPRFAQGGPVTTNNTRSENYTIVNHGRAAEKFADPRYAKWLSKTTL